MYVSSSERVGFGHSLHRQTKSQEKHSDPFTENAIKVLSKLYEKRPDTFWESMQHKLERVDSWSTNQLKSSLHKIGSNAEQLKIELEFVKNWSARELRSEADGIGLSSSQTQIFGYSVVAVLLLVIVLLCKCACHKSPCKFTTMFRKLRKRGGGHIL